MYEQRTSEPNITCPKCRHRHPASRSCAEAKRLADETQAERWRLKQLEREQESSKERLIRSLLHAYEEARDSSAPGPCEILKAAADEIERLGKELNRVTRGDVSNVITTLGDALTEIGRLTREVKHHQSRADDLRDRDAVSNRECEALEDENDRLRAALERIEAGTRGNGLSYVNDIAREALRPADEGKV